MRFEKPTAGTKPGSGSPELSVVRASDLDDAVTTDFELPLELPAELATLGEQLQSDAARLANLYPTSANRAVSESRRSAVRITLRRMGAAAAVLVTGVIGAWQLMPLRPAAHPPGSAVSMSRDPAVPGNPSPPADSLVTGRPATYSVAELSGPELEALVDLMQRDPAAVQRVSF
jgi:hypothetical protein